MKTRNLLFTGIIGIGILIFVLSGCNKDATSVITDVTAAQDELNASNTFNDSKNVSDAAVQANQSEYGPSHNAGINGLTSHCTIKWNDTAIAAIDSLTINFGSSPVLCNDGRYRQGEMIVFWNKVNGKHLVQAYFDSGSTITLTYQNYAVGSSATNMIEVNGNVKVTNNGGNVTLANGNNENWTFSSSLNITYLANNKTATWNATNCTSTLVNVTGTWYYEISGSVNGTCESGTTYTVSVSGNNPLYHTVLPLWLKGCQYIEAGQVTITLSSTSNILTINFGPLGTCSSTCTATLAGNTYTINMI